MRKYKPPLLNRYPFLAEFGWLIWPIGLIRYWGQPWCTWNGGFFPLSSPLPALWWPIKLHQRKKYEGVPIWWQHRG